MIAKIVSLLLLAAFVHSSPTGRCPSANPRNNTYFLADQAKCNLFHICDAGVAKQSTCPEGLHFNPQLSVCDYPEYAGCISGDANDADLIQAVQNSLPRPPVSKYDWLCRTATSRRKEIPNPWDIHKFYLCVDGFAKEFTCPRKQIFNAWHQRCEDNVEIQKPHSSFNVCKYAKADHYHFLDIWDSNKFIECDLNTRHAYVMSCPAGLEFNPRIQVCDWPKN